MDTYYDSAEGITITRRQAVRLLREHDALAAWDEFTAECGDQASYDAQAVLRWLGY